MFYGAFAFGQILCWNTHADSNLIYDEVFTYTNSANFSATAYPGCAF
jgi:hypothetical protein